MKAVFKATAMHCLFCLFRRNIVYYIYTHDYIHGDAKSISKGGCSTSKRHHLTLYSNVFSRFCASSVMYRGTFVYKYTSMYNLYIIYNIIMSMMSMCSGSKCVVRYRYATYFINTVDGRNPAPVGRWFIYVYMPF